MGFSCRGSCWCEADWKGTDFEDVRVERSWESTIATTSRGLTQQGRRGRTPPDRAAREPSGSKPDGLRHGHGWIPINGSLITKVTQITIVTSANCRRQRDVRAWKGVTCRRVLESHLYRWRRRPLSGSALQSVSRRQRSASHAQVLPPLPNPLRLRRPLRPCPRRPAAYRQGTDLPTRMNARRYPGWVSCRWPSSTR